MHLCKHVFEMQTIFFTPIMFTNNLFCLFRHCKKVANTLWKTLPPPPPPRTITTSSKILQAYCMPQNFFFVDFSLKKSMIFQPEFPFGFFWFSFLLLVLIKERRPNEHFWLRQPFIYPPLTLFFKNVLLRVLRLPTFTPLLQHLYCQLIIWY